MLGVTPDKVEYKTERYARLKPADPRHPRHIQRCLRPRRGNRMLEVGCGSGRLTRLMQDQGVDATGVDVNADAIAASVATGCRVMSADGLSFADESFDLVASFHTIEHVPRIDVAIAEMARVVRPGGRILLVYPAEPIRGLYAIPASVILYKHPFKARDIHCHKLAPAKVQGLAASAGLRHLASYLSPLPGPEFVSTFVRPLHEAAAVA